MINKHKSFTHLNNFDGHIKLHFIKTSEPVRTISLTLSLTLLSSFGSFMATTITSFRPPKIQASASRKPDPNRNKPLSQNWWSPLFGWSSDPDYINSGQSKNANVIPYPENESGQPRSKFSLGCFTEEKAKKLRRKTTETSTFHDLMYHSAIASRLAFDWSDRQEK